MSDSISELIKLARYQLSKAGFVDTAAIQGGGGGMPPGGAPPMDPAMMGGMPPGGAPPMDPSMMGGMPMDPAMMGGAPPMDPSMMGGMPMDPSMMMDPAMMGGAAPPPAEGGSGDITETIRQIIKEELAASGGGSKPKSGGKVNLEADLAAIKSVLSQMAGALGLQVPATALLGSGGSPDSGSSEGSSKSSSDGAPMPPQSRATIDKANRLVAILSSKNV